MTAHGRGSGRPLRSVIPRRSGHGLVDQSFYCGKWGFGNNGTKSPVKPSSSTLATSCRLFLIDRRIAQGPQFAPRHRFRHRKGIAAQHVDVVMDKWRKPGHIRLPNRVSLQAQLIEGCLHVDGVPQDDHVKYQAQRPELILLTLPVALTQFAALAMEDGASQAVPAQGREVGKINDLTAQLQRDFLGRMGVADLLEPTVSG